MIRMVNSGTEAVMSAIRAARGFTGKDKIIKFAGCYHGHSDCLLVSAGSGVMASGIPDSAGVPKGCTQDTMTLPTMMPPVWKHFSNRKREMWQRDRGGSRSKHGCGSSETRLLKAAS